jgi:hypothetical protein
VKKQLRAIYHFYIDTIDNSCRNCGRPDFLDCIDDALCARIDRFVRRGLGDPESLLVEARRRLPRIMATFQPQAWINDYATEIDGAKKFDCTKEILRLSPKDVRRLRDDQYDTDNLLPEEIRKTHNGPFYVAVRDEIFDFFKKLGLKADAPGFSEARKIYGIGNGKRSTTTV